MKVELLKKHGKHKKGTILDVTTDKGRELIASGNGEATDKDSYNDQWLKAEIADENNVQDVGTED